MNITSRQLKAFVLTARHQSFSRAAEQLSRAGRATPPDATCNFLETQIAMVESGAGAAVIPASAAPACAKRQVTMHTLVDPVVWAEFCWLSSRARALSPSAEDFGDFLRGYLTHICDQGPGNFARAA